MTPSPESLAAARGAAFLDERVPGWEERIDLERLDLESPCRCVLGQLYGDFDKGNAQLGTSWQQDVEFGFDAADDDNFDALTAAWRSLIEQRKETT